MTIEEKTIQNLLKIIDNNCSNLAANMLSISLCGTLLVSVNDANKWFKIYFLEENNIFNEKNIQLSSKIFNTKMTVFNTNCKKARLNQYEQQQIFKEGQAIVKKYVYVEVYKYLTSEDYANEIREKNISEIQICKNIIDILKNKNVTENILKINDFYNVISDYIINFNLSPIEKLELLILIYEKVINTSISNDNIKSNYELLKEKYNNKDYLEVKELLQNMNVNEALIIEIVSYLNKSINKAHKKSKKEKREVSLKFNFKEEIENKNKKKKELEKKLENYLDLRTKLLKRFLTREEIDRVVYILKFLDYNKDEIRKILICNELFLGKLSAIDRYEYFKDKIDFYKDSHALLEDAEELSQYYKEAKAAENEDDKRFFTSCLGEKLSNVLKLIPNTFDYEIEKEY